MDYPYVALAPTPNKNAGATLLVFTVGLSSWKIFKIVNINFLKARNYSLQLQCLYFF
jgi:hypothetical protein